MNVPDLSIIAKSKGATDILGIFGYGSYVYGTNDENSDKDYIVVSNTVDTSSYTPEIIDDCDITFYQIDEFSHKLNDHYLPAIECISQDDPIYYTGELSLTLDLTLLRKEISARASNSWAKARKKMTVGSIEPLDTDYRTGLKSLFHVHRMTNFGIQIATHGKIIDYSASNWFWDEIKHYSGEWSELDTRTRSILNGLKTEFRQLAPKG